MWSDWPGPTFLPIMLSCRWRFCRDVGPRRDSVGTLFSLLPSSRSSCNEKCSVSDFRRDVCCGAVWGCVGLDINEWQAETGGVTGGPGRLGESLMGKQWTGGNQPAAHHQGPPTTICTFYSANCHTVRAGLYSSAGGQWGISTVPGKINLVCWSWAATLGFLLHGRSSLEYIWISLWWGESRL